ncbi:branched-chain alpha-keto acid dehydrogenase subunit E2 [bacterium]|nr:branched-chain alpha-keto acid dehydrogenase subunit E2 [bacterium]
MKQEIRVPEVSDGVEKGTVIGLSVSVGDRVEEDQTLLELETDKAVVGLPAPFTGTISEILVDEGDEVEVGQVVMTGEPEGEGQDEAPQEEEPAAQEDERGEEGADEEAPAEDGDRPASDEKEADADREEDRTAEKTEDERDEASEPAPDGDEDAKEAPKTDAKKDLPPPRTESTPPDQVAPASPIVRRFARELGVDINAVEGSGPGGRIGEDDVQAFVKRVMESGAARPGGAGGAVTRKPLPDFSKWGEVERQKLSQVRKITAESMAYAWATAPHVTQDDKADITAVESFRQDYNRKAPDEGKLTMTAILVKIVASALKAFPGINASLDLASEELVLKKYVHVGVAVDTPGGLLVPVIRDADRKGLATLATELNDTAQRTRERRISPADMEGGTFTISNLGGIGGTSFTPIVYAPQVAILGVSRAEMEPVWDGQDFAPRLRLPLSLSYDHRVVDGADGARFLRWICSALEQPLMLAMEDER